MKHLFSSGETTYKKNARELTEGFLEGEFLEYKSIESDTLFECSGLLNENAVRVLFTLSEFEYEGIKRRYDFGILMQSDIFLADWKSYEILALEI